MLARRTYRLEPDQVRRLILERIHVRECDSPFCANAECVLHVSPGDLNVKGNGNWAETPDGIITGRQRIQSDMLCDRCASKVARGELALQLDFAANALRLQDASNRGGLTRWRFRPGCKV
jgi:hypothetical protein